MLSSISLKYRIAAIIFVLEAVMMTFVLGIILKNYDGYIRDQSTVNEQVFLNLLSSLSRTALITAEYDELQPYVEQIKSDPRVQTILLLNTKSRVVVSSDVKDVGARAPFLRDSGNEYWRQQEISNASGKLGTLAIRFSNASLVAANSKALNLGVALALGGMIAIAVIGVMIGYLLTRRLERLKLVAQKMAEGDLGVTVEVSGNDEIAIVGESFNHMARNVQKVVQELRVSETELRDAHEALEQRIQERTRQLAIARDQALDASRTKSTFLANMSHELRTPLNAIIGYSEMLHDEAVETGNKDSADDIGNITTAGKHLLGLINDILDLSKIEAGKIEFRIDTFEIAAMAHEVINTVRPVVEKNHNRFHIHIPDNVGSMTSDPVKVRQIIINLLANAGKFTENGEVTFAVRRENEDEKEWIAFSVKDNGIGISETQMENLFTEFAQGDIVVTRKYGGTGLGLSISERFCKLLGGQIHVQSKTGEGSLFTVRLPAVVDPCSLSADEKKEMVPEVVRFEKTKGAGFSNSRRAYISRVLIIDHNPEINATLSTYLNKQGFKVYTATTSEAGLEIAKQKLPDVIALDMSVPEDDGWFVLKALKMNANLAKIPVIMFTATNDKRVTYTYGSTHYLSKPFDRQLLMNMIRECVRHVN